MAELLARLLPLGLAAAISPQLLAVTMAILGARDHPRSRTLAYLGGSALTLVLIGILAVTGGGAARGPHRPSALSAAIDIILGALLLYLGVRKLVAKPKTRHVEPASGRASIGRQLVVSAGLGLLLTVTDFSSLVFYVAAAKQTADSRLRVTDQVIAMSVMALFIMVPIIVPLVFTVAAPAAAARLLSWTDQAAKKHGKYIVAAIALIFGVYLVLKGTRAL